MRERDKTATLLIQSISISSLSVLKREGIEGRRK